MALSVHLSFGRPRMAGAHARLAVAGAAVAAALLLAACGTSSTGSAGSGGGGGTSPTVASPATSAAAGTVDTRTGPFGVYLTDQNGRSLYLFTTDTNKTSTCNGACATAWPPLTATGTPTAGGSAQSSMLGTITRSDGTMQVTYGGHPLYYYAKDASPGDSNGQGLNKKWYLLAPNGGMITGGAAGGGSTTDAGGGSPTKAGSGWA